MKPYDFFLFLFYILAILCHQELMFFRGVRKAVHRYLLRFLRFSEIRLYLVSCAIIVDEHSDQGAQKHDTATPKNSDNGLADIHNCQKIHADITPFAAQTVQTITTSSK